MRLHTEAPRLPLPQPRDSTKIGKVITKAALTSARSCGERAYRGLVLAEWRPPPGQRGLAYYRAQHQAILDVHRIWQRHGEVEEAALTELWADAWVTSGGIGEPNEEGLAWLGAYVRTNPFLTNRRLLAVELTLQVFYLGRKWSTRPDALAIARNGDIVCLELSGARHPIANRTEVQTQSAIDQLALRYSHDLPLALRERPQRVIIGALQSARQYDVTLEWSEAEHVLAKTDAFLRHIEAGNREPEPSKETCEFCPFTDCAARWRLANPAET